MTAIFRNKMENHLAFEDLVNVIKSGKTEIRFCTTALLNLFRLSTTVQFYMVFILKVGKNRLYQR